MRTLTRLGPICLALAVACGPRTVSEERGDVTVRVPARAPTPAPMEVTLESAIPEPAVLPKRERARARRVWLPAPTGLRVERDGPLILSVGPVDWSSPVSIPRPDPAVVADHLERIDAHEITLADLARERFELSRSLEAIVDVLPVLSRQTRLRAGLRVCALRRDLEELERMQRGVQRDVLAFRELIVPAVRLAESR